MATRVFCSSLCACVFVGIFLRSRIRTHILRDVHGRLTRTLLSAICVRTHTLTMNISSHYEMHSCWKSANERLQLNNHLRPQFCSLTMVLNTRSRRLHEQFRGDLFAESRRILCRRIRCPHTLITFRTGIELALFLFGCRCTPFKSGVRCRYGLRSPDVLTQLDGTSDNRGHDDARGPAHLSRFDTVCVQQMCPLLSCLSRLHTPLSCALAAFLHQVRSKAVTPQAVPIEDSPASVVGTLCGVTHLDTVLHKVAALDVPLFVTKRWFFLWHEVR